MQSIDQFFQALRVLNIGFRDALFLAVAWMDARQELRSEVVAERSMLFTEKLVDKVAAKHPWVVVCEGVGNESDGLFTSLEDSCVGEVRCVGHLLDR